MRFPDFRWTTIQLNKNVECKPHIDTNNVGKSLILGWGNYTGGELVIEGKLHNIKNKFLFFDGNRGHWTQKWIGDRYSIIFFTHTFTPPHPHKHGIVVTKEGIFKKEILLRTFV